MVSRAPAVLAIAVFAALTVPVTAAGQTGSLATDDRGFIDTEARCDEPMTAVAFGRTQRSLVAICVQDGEYQYRGVRLSDDALLESDAVESDDGAFVADHDGVTYTFSAKNLVIATTDKVLRTEPMVAYVEPRLAAEG